MVDVNKTVRYSRKMHAQVAQTFSHSNVLSSDARILFHRRLFVGAALKFLYFDKTKEYARPGTANVISSVTNLYPSINKSPNDSLPSLASSSSVALCFITHSPVHGGKHGFELILGCLALIGGKLTT